MGRLANERDDGGLTRPIRLFAEALEERRLDLGRRGFGVERVAEKTEHLEELTDQGFGLALAGRVEDVDRSFRGEVLWRSWVRARRAFRGLIRRLGGHNRS